MIRLRILFLCFVVLKASGVNGQSKKEIFEQNVTLTFLGLDFTGTKFIGDLDKFKSDEEVHELLKSWNDLIFSEPDKYDIAAAIDRKKVESALDITVDHNRELEIADLVSASPKDFFHLSPAKIFDIIAGYDFKGKEGIGLMLNIESFSKLNESGALWFTFVDMKSRKIIFTERMIGEPGGFGIRNYWATCIYRALKQVEKKEFSVWRKKYYQS
jgi:hypothetical protein